MKPSPTNPIVARILELRQERSDLVAAIDAKIKAYETAASLDGIDISSLGTSTLPTVAATPRIVEGRSSGKTQMVKDALQYVGDAFTLDDVENALAALDHDLKRLDISFVLSRLKAKGEIFATVGKANKSIFHKTAPSSEDDPFGFTK